MFGIKEQCLSDMGYWKANNFTGQYLKENASLFQITKQVSHSNW